MNIRLAKIEEASQLSQLAVNAKAYWPYDKEFIDKCIDDLTLHPKHIVEGLVYVLEDTHSIKGYYAFEQSSRGYEMIALFVDPKMIGKGYGKKLWLHACSLVKDRGYSQFELVADPYAAKNFYYKRGCVKVGDFESPVKKGRILPVLQYEI